MEKVIRDNIQKYNDILTRNFYDGVLTTFISKINNHPSIGKIIEALPQRIKKEFYSYAKPLMSIALSRGIVVALNSRSSDLFWGFTEGLVACKQLPTPGIHFLEAVWDGVHDIERLYRAMEKLEEEKK